MAHSRVELLYLAGVPHSGSTLLSRVLGEADGVVATGELWFLWQQLLRGGDCGCGRRLSACPAWGQILESAYGRASVPRDEAIEMHRVALAHFGLRKLPLLAFRRRSHLPADLVAYSDRTERLYRAISTVTGCRLIVDASKSLTLAYLVAGLPGIDLRLVQLVRDARATAYSERLRKRQGLSPVVPPASGAAQWVLKQLAAELAWPRRHGRLLLRYEDFVRRPVELADQLLGPEYGVPSTSHRSATPSVRLTASHTVFGNDNRFRTGLVEIEEDRAWKLGLSLRDRLLVTGIAWPLLLRYGYSLRLERVRTPDRPAASA